MLPVSIVKYILYFLFLFGIIYIDQRNTTFSLVWKAILVLILLVDIIRLQIYNRYKRPAFLKTAYLWGIKNSLNWGLIEYPLETISYGFKFSILPILCEYFDKKFQSKDNLFRIGLTFSQYVILSNIPFLLGILTPEDTAIEYDGITAYTGLFTGQHGTATVTASSMIFLLYAFTDRSKDILYRIYNMLLFCMALYVLYSAFTRTGWAMAFIGIIVFIFFRKLNIKTFIIGIIICLGIFWCYNYIYENNERFYNRINDIADDGNYKKAEGSGRLIYAAVSLKLFEDGDTLHKLFGTGIDPLMDNMYKKIFNRIYSHNGWIDALTANGVVGLTLMVLMVISMLVYIVKHRKQKYSELSMACIVMYISYQSTQGGVFFYQDMFISIAMALIITDSKIKEKLNIEMFGLKNIDINAIKNNINLNENTSDK